MSLPLLRNSLSRPSRPYLAFLAIALMWSSTAMFVVRKLYAEGVQPITAPPLYRYRPPQVFEPRPSRKVKKWKDPRLGIDSAAAARSPYQPRNLTEPDTTTLPPMEPEEPLPVSTSAVSDVNRVKNNLSDGTGALFGSEQVTAYSQQSTGGDSKWRVTPHLRYSVVYDSNPFLGGENDGEEDNKSSAVFTVAPGVSFRFGSDLSPLYLSADYTAGFVLFGNDQDASSVDHNANINFKWRRPKLTVGVNLGLVATTGANIDVGDRVQRRSYYAGVTSTYAYSEKISFDLSADLAVPTYVDQSFLDSREVRVQGFVNYQVSDKLQLGIGGTVGFIDATDGDPQTFQQGLFRVIYAASEKLAFNASAGLQTLQSNAGDEFTPVFSLGLAYKPFDGTTISLDGRRRTYASAALTGQDYEATGVVASVRQRFLRKFYFSLAAGFEHDVYISVLDGVSASRVDEYYFVRPSFDWEVNDHLSVGIFYEHDENTSRGQGARPFSRNLFGTQGNVSF